MQVSASAERPVGISARPLLGDLFAFLARLGKADGNRLFSTLDFTSLPAWTALGRALLVNASSRFRRPCPRCASNDVF